MKKAKRNDKQLVVAILSDSFDENQSVNYIVTQDDQRKVRIKALMDYSFEMCYRFGTVYLSDDGKACALILYPNQKKVSFQSLWLDVKLVFNAIGLSRAIKAIRRESAIKGNYPKEPIYYLWFLGVSSADQNNGLGTRLLNEIINDSERQKKPVYLETSTLQNIPWYQKNGFEIYKELDFGYKLYMLRRGSVISVI
ncbi:MAG: GNAT family N-acetyltransferase [Sphingobacteriaceae bacterium]|nr:MAG: GNAT family N-acetyltransferase [Sphingobacteriaceae bacterium]